MAGTEKKIIFVYGTLKRGEVNYLHWMADASECRYIGRAKTIKKYPFFVNSAEFKCAPCVLDVEDDAEMGVHVVGELFEVSAKLQAIVHALEGVSTGVYKVGMVDVENMDATTPDQEKALQVPIYFRHSRFPENWRSEESSGVKHIPNGWFSAKWSLEHMPTYNYVAPHFNQASNLAPPFTPKPQALIIIDGTADNTYPVTDMISALEAEIDKTMQATNGDKERWENGNGLTKDGIASLNDLKRQAADASSTAGFNLTPLEFAAKLSPGLNLIAKNGVNGLMDPYQSGSACGSDTAHLSLFGYDPQTYYRGRGAFESIGAGMDMSDTDIAFKCNFSTLDETTNIVVQRRCDRNFTKEGPVLCNVINGTVLEEDDVCREEGFALKNKHTIQCKYATEHRCGVVITGDGLSDQITGTDPLSDGKRLVKCASKVGEDHPEHAAAVYTSQVINLASRTISKLLRGHAINEERAAAGKAVANVVMLRGAASKGRVPPFIQRYGLKSFILAPTCIIRGLAATCGIEIVDCEGATGDYHSDYAAKAEVFSETLFAKGREHGDPPYHFGVLHVKGIDDAGHDKNMGMRLKLLIGIGRMIERVWDAAPEGTTFAVTADHSTPICIGDHSCEPVPFAMATKQKTTNDAVDVEQENNIGNVVDAVNVFSELAAAQGSLGRFEGSDLVHLMHRFHYKFHW